MALSVVFIATVVPSGKCKPPLRTVASRASEPRRDLCLIAPRLMQEQRVRPPSGVFPVEVRWNRCGIIRGVLRGNHAAADRSPGQGKAEKVTDLMPAFPSGQYGRVVKAHGPFTGRRDCRDVIPENTSQNHLVTVLDKRG
jgi:hypothetical protein